ncbi:hypothetical protein EDD16DRAFT_1519619 [Pisolithus croceorrhizus]|nr:hypothetical protein EV401DRAFT_1895746 [Pisolithus croceorrhizus]KAI6119069.1 hypothetical protein EDD16DRAFT_1519619 [Pisolithus croceorrhizus]
MPAFLTKAFSLSTLPQFSKQSFDDRVNALVSCPLFAELTRFLTWRLTFATGETSAFNILHGMVVDVKVNPWHLTFSTGMVIDVKQYTQGKISEMLTLTKIDVELAVMGIPFDQEEWLDLMGVILMDPTEGLNSIEAVRCLMQMKTNPLLEDPVTWQLVLQWVADDNVSFANFLTEMEARFKDRYKFDKWKIVFDQVFEASCEGNAVEVVRAAMAKRGVLKCPSIHDLSPQASSSGKVKSNSPLPPAKRLRPNNLVQRFLDTSMQDDDDDESVDENDQDNEVDRHPRVTEITPSGCTTLNKGFEHIFHRYSHEGGPKDQMHECIETQFMRPKLFVLQDSSWSTLSIEDYPAKCSNQFLDGFLWKLTIHWRYPQNKCDPSQSPVISPYILGNDITYVLSVDDSFIETLIVPWKLPYHPDNTPVNGHSLFDVGLAREYGLEVTVDTNHQGHPVAYCQGEGYYSGFSRIHFCKNRVKVSLLLPDEVAWFAVASIDLSLVNHTMTRFLAQWWQVGNTGRICSGEFTSKLARIVAMDPQSKSVTVLVLTDSASDDVRALKISIHDFKLEFPIGASVKVITGVNCGFQGMVISRTNDMFLLQGSDQQLEVPGTFLAMYISLVTYTSQAHYHVWPDPLATENHLQPGDSIHVISGPHKGLSGMLHYHSGHELLVTPLVQSKNTNDLGDKGKSKAQEPGATRGNGNGNEDSRAQATPIIQWENIDDLGDKGKSKAQEPETTRDNGNVDEDSDLMQVSICMDDAVVTPPPTLQFSKGMGYDVTVGDCVWVVHGPAVGVEGPVHTVDLVTGHLVVLSEDGPWYDVPIGFCMKLQDYCLRDIECQVGCEVWIISGPSKGYRGTLWSVERTTCKVAIHSGIMQLKHTAVVNESGILLSVPPHHTTPPPSPPIVDPSVESGPSTSAYNPWVVNCDDATSQCSNKMVQQEADYGHIPWLFNNDFCDYSNWHICLRVSLSYNHGSLVKRVVHTTAPDCFSTITQGCGLAPPGCVSITVSSSTVSVNVEHHFIPARDLTPANPTSARQFCVILKGKLASQIHWVKKCQSKKAPKGVELEDGTKLPFRDVCQVMPMSSHSVVGHQLRIIAGFSYAHLISFTHPQVILTHNVGCSAGVFKFNPAYTCICPSSDYCELRPACQHQLSSLILALLLWWPRRICHPPDNTTEHYVALVTTITLEVTPDSDGTIRHYVRGDAR